MVDWSNVVPETNTDIQVHNDNNKTSASKKENLWNKTDFNSKRIERKDLKEQEKTITVTGPIEILPEDKNRIITIIKNLIESDFILRSGYDKRSPFEIEILNIYKQYNAKIHYQLPWKKFTEESDIRDEIGNTLFYPKLEAYEYASYYNPNFSTLKPPVRAIVARMVHQVLGDDLKTPVSMVLCYDKYGIDDVTKMKYPYTTLGMMLSFAKDAGIPVFNLKKETAVKALVGYVTTKY